MPRRYFDATDRFGYMQKGGFREPDCKICGDVIRSKDLRFYDNTDKVGPICLACVKNSCSLLGIAIIQVKAKQEQSKAVAKSHELDALTPVDVLKAQLMATLVAPMLRVGEPLPLWDLEKCDVIATSILGNCGIGSHLLSEPQCTYGTDWAGQDYILHPPEREDLIDKAIAEATHNTEPTELEGW